MANKKLEGDPFFPDTKLTRSRTPKQLLTWMSKNLTYEGKYKGYLRNPEQVVKDKKGHCWETSELVNRELTALGYVCQTLYLVNNDLYGQDTVTHSTIIFKDKLNKYFWFEWSWYEQEGIHGPFKNLNETINFVISCFKKQYTTISTVKISGVGLMHLTTETEYINSTDKWTDVILEPYKNIIYKW